MHFVCEELVVDNSKIEQAKLIFQRKFLEELTEISKTHQLNKKLVTDMRKQGDDIIQYILPSLTNHFNEYKVVAVEEMLFEDIRTQDFDTDYKFKGFIDLVLRTNDGKYHIIDWKTCSWGWDMKKKTDKIISYQLTLYKNFYALKYNIDVNNIETHFALLKRTAKKNRAEIFRVSSGERKTSNALAHLKKALYNIEAGNVIKNRTACKYCEFYQTEHCR